MKITDYEKVQALAASNIFLLDGPNGTKTIAADALAKALIGLLSSKDFIGGVNLSELQWSFAELSSEVRISEQL